MNTGPVEKYQGAQQASGPSVQLTALQQHFLSRLDDLVRRRDELCRKSDPDPFSKKLVARAIYTTLLDCINAGVGDQAQAILDAGRGVTDQNHRN